MPDFEMHLGKLTETPDQVTFELVVRDGEGRVDLGVAQVTVPKPLTEQALRAAMNNAARSMLASPTRTKEFVTEMVNRLNRGL